jgi:hypothetical protein
MKTGASIRARGAVSAPRPAAGIAPAISTPLSEPAHGSETRTIYRALLMRGLRPSEAANLTAFLSGIHVGDHEWKLVEVNRLLFLRELETSGRLDVVGTTRQGTDPGLEGR